MALPTRRLGNSGIEVTALGLGCMSMSGTYGDADDAKSIRVIHQALDAGLTFLDTSDMYGFGHNEELLGKALKGRRHDVVLATKFGNLGPGKGVNGTPEYVMQACEASLQRLGVDVIDLYYQHRMDPNVPVEDTVGAMARLVEQGKVRALGLSEAHPDRIRRAAAVHPIAALQSEYSLLYRLPAEEDLPTTRELDIAFVAYSPLGRGLLTGSVQAGAIPEGDRRLAHPRYQGENLTHNLDLVARFTAMALEKDCTPGQLALAWVLARGDDLIPIPGTKSPERLAENIGALNVHLSAAELRTIEETFPPGAGAGTRYPEGAMKGVHI